MEQSLPYPACKKPMLKNSLICHPDTACAAIHSLHAAVEALPDKGLRLRYELNGDLAQLRIPAPRPPAAIDGLWEHTCFEAFIAVDGESAYHEFNFSPSGQWAAYAFSGYRKRKDWTFNQPPLIRVVQTHRRLLLETLIAAADLPPNTMDKALRIGLTAVLEAGDGSLSYWALQHPSAKPDFHHRGGFISAFIRT